MREVHVVSVFENGDMTTTVWGVFSTKAKAEAYKRKLEEDSELNSDGYHLIPTISSHKVD